MLPLYDDNSGRRLTPYVLWAIFGLNCVVWYLQLTLGEPFTLGYSTIPYEIVHGVDLRSPKWTTLYGSPQSIPQAPGPSPIYLTLFSAMFMHGSWGHIGGNMLYLLIFGDQIEDLLGHARFALFYFVCGLCAGAAQILSSPESVIPSLGASGAIAGVLGAYLIRFPRNHVQVLVYNRIVSMPASFVLGGWIIMQLVSQVQVYSGADSEVAYMAHIGGFAAGVIMILTVGPKPSRESSYFASERD
ncbi:MAG: rhomboid family intramembrane serine protease [Bdellovibrionota bacterium]